jgi:glycerol-3-phosphate dehydrogenase subunit B
VSATPRVIVVGAGIAGAAAALAAARSGGAVTLVDGGPGATTLATGALDRTPWRADDTDAPALPAAARDVLEALGAYVVTPRAVTLFTTAGVRRPSGGRDAALFDAAPVADRPVGVVRCLRPGWDADALARSWGGACVAVDATLLRHRDERALPDADFAARHDEEGRLEWLAGRLREALATGSGGEALAGLVLPPSLGVDRARAGGLSQRVGLPCGEALSLPGGPSGLRFERARDRALSTAGIERVRARARKVERLEHGPGRSDVAIWRVILGGDSSLDAEAVVLATGGLLGGGLEYAPSEAILAAALPPHASAPFRASLEAPLRLGAHGRPLEVPGSLFGLAPEQIAWPFSPDGLLERAGVLVGDDGACVGTPRGLFAAGELVADAPHTWLCALIRGASAGVSAARSSGEPSPARGPASRP